MGGRGVEVEAETGATLNETERGVGVVEAGKGTAVSFKIGTGLKL